MSRHKLVKNLDLEEELDDYDGGDDYGYGGYGEVEEDAGGGGLETAPLDEDMTEEERENMRVGISSIHDILGPDVPDISDREIRDALWNAYWDVGVAVDELLKARVKRNGERKEAVKKKKKKGGLYFSSQINSTLGTCGGEDGDKDYFESYSEDGLGEYLPQTCKASSSGLKSLLPAGFWNDMQWLNVPRERQTIFIEPPYPPGGLLGGSPDAAPKMSKLQALAAARKKKAQEQKAAANVEAEDKAMVDVAATETNITGKSAGSPPGAPGSASKSIPTSYPVRKRKNSSPHAKTLQPPVSKEERQAPGNDSQTPLPVIEPARPSAFANVMFGSHSSAPLPVPPSALFTIPYATKLSLQSADAFAGPSPDDIVLAAQSKAANAKTSLAKNTKAAPQKTNNEKKADQIANGVEALRIDDTPRATSKNLDVLAEYGKKKAKNAANFVVIGHVDAGKSTLMGRLLYDLKVVDQRTIDKYRKEAEKIGKSSFALAWVLDQGTEERSRGVTIDIATNKFETEKTVFTILDAPGHRDFIPNMIAGASQADFAVLVVDASTGSFESGLKGQTKEHALLVRSMGVQRLIIAINKLDTVSWSKDRFDEISQQVSAFLTAAGFQSRNISFVPVSGLHGDNIITHSKEVAASWYSGPTLVEELDNSEPVARSLDKPLRLTIGDIFRGGVQNPLSISGRIEAGSLQAGDALTASPSGQKCYIKSLEMDSEPVDWAVAGHNVVVHLTGIDPAHLKIGDVLCRPGSEIQSVKEIRVKVLAFEHLWPMAVDVHRGRLHAAGRISEITALLDKGTGAVTKKRPKVVKPGGLARLVVELEGLYPLETGQRVILRDAGETVGAGLVE